MSEIMLFLFEGESTEPQIFDNIEKVFFSNEQTGITKALYKQDIYNLYENLNQYKDSDDGFDIDLIELLIERKSINPDDIDVNKISSIYLFFDLDIHAYKKDEKVTAAKRTEAINRVKKLVEYFGNETEQGKMYISYPMIEALRAYGDTWGYCEICSIEAKDSNQFKDMVKGKNSFSDFTRYNFPIWKDAIISTIDKLYCLSYLDPPECKEIASIEYEEVMKITNQNNILTNQENKFVSNGMIMILSSVPLFLVDFFGKPLFNSTYLER